LLPVNIAAIWSLDNPQQMKAEVSPETIETQYKMLAGITYRASA
jgi:hypothetical protein